MSVQWRWRGRYGGLRASFCVQGNGCVFCGEVLEILLLSDGRTVMWLCFAPPEGEREEKSSRKRGADFL